MKLNFYSKKSALSKTIFQISFLFSFLLSSNATFAQGASCTNNYVQIGSYHVEFVHVEYDFPTAGQSTWYYTVEATSGKDISHVTFPVDLKCVNVLDAGTWDTNLNDLNSGKGIPEIGKDPKAKVIGVKFDRGIDTGEEENYYFTLDKNLEITPVADISVKAGKPFYKGTVCGPSPDCEEYIEVIDESPCTSCLSGSAFHDANINSIWDADENTIAGITVQLYSSDFSTSYGSTQTDAEGNYSFCDLEENSYVVVMKTAGTQYTITTTNTSSEFGSDIQDFGHGTGVTNPLSLTCSGMDFVDGGFYLPGDGTFQNFNTNSGNDEGITNTSTSSKKNRTTTSNNNFDITDNTITETPTVQQKTDVEIFPSLFRDEVTVRSKMSNREEIRVEIRTQDMALVETTTMRTNDQEQHLNLSRLSPGVYFAIFIQNNGSTSVQKIVKF